MGGRTPNPAHPSSRCLLVFTKPAVPGRVKTRLLGHLSPASAARLHQALLGDLLTALEGGSFSVRVDIAVDPPAPLPAVRHPVVAAVERQRGADLGERMLNALTDAGRCHPLVGVVGSDLPGLDAGRVDDAFDRLEHGADVVIGPTADGGYYLLALRSKRIDPALFAGVAWSTGRVLEQTLERCQKLGLRRSMLETGRDIDRPGDLQWLIENLRAGRLESPLVAAWLRRRDAGLDGAAARGAGVPRSA
jgi:hypothetical protein